MKQLLTTMLKEMGKGLFVCGVILGGVAAYCVADYVATDTRKAAIDLTKVIVPQSVSILCPPELGLRSGSVCSVFACEVSKEETNCLITVTRAKETSL